MSNLNVRATVRDTATGEALIDLGTILFDDEQERDEAMDDLAFLVALDTLGHQYVEFTYEPLV